MRDTHRSSCGSSRGRRRRHERVLHTRVSEALADDLRRAAEELRVPVSNLVRNVLEETFSVVESVTENMGDLFEDVVDEAEAARERVRRRQRGRRRGARWEARDPSPEPAPEPAADGAGATPSEDHPDVLGWQPLLLNREARCADCGQSIERGGEAHIAVTGNGLGPDVLCATCVAALR
ncbi:MAG: hypothetical protein AAF430_23595 [Myxococcota bacterium]